MDKACQSTRKLIVLLGTIVLTITGFSSVVSADTEVDSSVVVVVSDEIMKRTTNLERPGGNEDGDAAANGDEAGGGNDKNRSGLGDGTNPGQGSGTGNSPNEGTDNPNNAKGGGPKK